MVAASCLASSSAQAQAWVPTEGEAFVSVYYQSFDSPGHLNRLGQKIGGPTQSHTVLVEVEYGLTDEMALTVALPYVSAKYSGEGPACPLCVDSPFEFHPSPVDDGTYHGAVQDFRFGLRYNVIRKAVFVTPFVGVVVPSHRYENQGEAIVGRGFLEGQVGIYAGRDFGPFLPRGYAQGRYAYALVPPDLEVPLNRSDAAAEIGYALTSAVSIRGLGTWQRTHGGLPGVVAAVGSGDLLQHHDRLLQDNNWRVGGGGSCLIGPWAEISATVITVVSGTNTHRGTAITVSFTWTLDSRQVLSTVSAAAAARRASVSHSGIHRVADMP
jgi:hypothetical protein